MGGGTADSNRMTGPNSNGMIGPTGACGPSCCPNGAEGIISPKGEAGAYGPNDGGYIHACIVDAAAKVKSAQRLYSQGHYPHSNARLIPKDHSLRIAMKELAKLDEKYAVFANTKPNPDLFSTYEPPIEDQTRWDKYKGVSGES